MAWLRRLRAEGRSRETALADLHRLLLRVAHAEARRRGGELPDPVLAELDDLCLQAANDALLAVITNLDTFAGRSRFTTWAIKFAMFEVSDRLRRHAWRGDRMQLDEAEWSRLPDGTPSAQRRAEQQELLVTLRRAVAEVLSPRQREIFVSAALQEVPVDTLAERLGSNRGAVYKSLHDARHKLRQALADAGMGLTT